MFELLSVEKWNSLLGQHQRFVSSGGTDGVHLSLKNLALGEDISLDELDLSGADFSDSLLDNCSLSNANFRGASFCNAFIRSTFVDQADFTDCNFENAVFVDTSLNRCTFTGSNFDSVVCVRCPDYNSVDFKPDEVGFEKQVEVITRYIEKSPLAQRILALVKELTNDVLQDGVLYGNSIQLKEHGTSEKSWQPLTEGVEPLDFMDNPISEVLENMSYGNGWTDLYCLYPVHSIIELRLQKGELPTQKVLLARDIIEKAESEYFPDTLDEGSSCEAVVKYVYQKDLEMEVVWNEQQGDKTQSYDYCPNGADELVEGLYFALDRKLKILHISYKDGVLTLQSEPGYPELNMASMKEKVVTGSDDFEARKKEARAAIEMRNLFFASVGKLHEDVIYLQSGGLRGYDWPGQGTGLNQTTIRAIHTKDTTVLTTSGLTDIFWKEELDQLKYNGIGMEFYVEFDGVIPFEQLKYHPLIIMLNMTAQVAIGHGDFRKYLEKRNTTTIEMTLESLHPYVLAGGDMCNEISSYYPEDIENQSDSVGVLLGMSSNRVPATFQLNREVVMMVNVRPFMPQWLDNGLRGSEKRANATRKKMMELFTSKENGNLIPAMTLCSSGCGA